MKRITKQQLYKLTNRQNVMFAIFCAEQVFYLVNVDNKSNAEKCIKLAKLWLEGKVTADDAYAAANATYIAKAASVNANAANAAAYAAVAAANAADTVLSITGAAYAVTYAAEVATSATYAATYSKQRDEIIREQLEYYDNLLNLDRYAEEMLYT